MRKLASYHPAGKAAYAVHDNRGQAVKLAKVAKGSKNPKTASAARTLAKAKAGDPKAKANIIKVNRMAKNGDPRAMDAVKRLNALNNITKSKGLNRFYDYGLS
jgi:hypothetical protein